MRCESVSVSVSVRVGVSVSVSVRVGVSVVVVVVVVVVVANSYRSMMGVPVLELCFAHSGFWQFFQSFSLLRALDSEPMISQKVQSHSRNKQLSGDLHRQLPDQDQQRMVQALLDQRAVPGSSSYFIGLNLDETDEHALQALLQHEWVTLPRAEDNYSFQLSMKTLQLFTVQFGLQTPFKVFQRRPDLALTDATSFELVLEVQGLGFQHKEKTRQSESFFTRGSLIRICLSFHLHTMRSTCCHWQNILFTVTNLLTLTYFLTLFRLQHNTNQGGKKEFYSLNKRWYLIALVAHDDIFWKGCSKIYHHQSEAYYRALVTGSKEM